MAKKVKPTSREKTLVEKWLYGWLDLTELAKKLGKTRVGAYSTIARVYKHNHNKNDY